MLVRNLVSWAGMDFSFVPGQEIDLPDEVAAARIAAGLVEAIEPPADEAPSEDAPKRGRAK